MTRIADALQSCAAADVSPSVAVAQLLLATSDVDAILAAIAELSATDAKAASRLADMRRLVANARPECLRVAELAKSSAGTETPHSTEFWRQQFDAYAAESEEASVALYSLGDPVLLARSTDEVVTAFREWGLISPRRDILQIGCGIGRFEQQFAPLVRFACGTDLSLVMLEAAQRHCAAMSNACFVQCDGHGLSAFGNESFDVIYAVDSFPYIVNAGDNIAAAHFADAGRVLRRGCDFVILNYSYRGDKELDGRDVAVHARDAGLEVVDCGSTPFSIWDASVFRLKRTS